MPVARCSNGNFARNFHDRQPGTEPSNEGLTPVDLEYDEAETAFRHEVREFLAANVPSEPLPSMDTAEGFEAHREWERKLFDARLSVVAWPEEFGGRDASLLEWVIFEEEYYRAQAPG